MGSSWRCAFHRARAPWRDGGQESAGFGADCASMERLPRDFVGYGAHPPDPRWPGGARLALQIVMNYEEGSEYAIGEGDAASETYLTEVPARRSAPASAT